MGQKDNEQYLKQRGHCVLKKKSPTFLFPLFVRRYDRREVIDTYEALCRWPWRADHAHCIFWESRFICQSDMQVDVGSIV